uniref:C6 domain-containing protein n=1 Tax=Strongyloides stercoralis TaxID=6248 RepID=A0A0K0EM86_STRER
MNFRYLIKFNIILYIVLFISYTYGCLPIIPPVTTPPPPDCCDPLTLNLKRRVPPPAGSFSAGWDQCSLLNSYSNEPCPTRGMFTCRVAPYSNSVNANLQLIQNNLTVVEEETNKDISEIWVNCVNGQWKINGKSFTHVSCSER